MVVQRDELRVPDCAGMRPCLLDNDSSRNRDLSVDVGRMLGERLDFSADSSQR